MKTKTTRKAKLKLVLGGPVVPELVANNTNYTAEYLKLHPEITGAAKTGVSNAGVYSAAGNMAGQMVDTTVPDNSKGNVGRTTASSALKGAGMGAAVGSAVPVIGTAVGAVVGGVLGAASGLIKGSGERSKIRSTNRANALVDAQSSSALTQSKFNAPVYGMKKGGAITKEKAAEILHDGTANGVKLTRKQQKFMGYMSKHGKAEGGEIKGAGSSKSDSIPAKLSQKGFVVPTENFDKAKEIAQVFLGHKDDQMAKLKSGGVPVKVSDGEYYFSPEEVKSLTSMGVDLNSLAPNADTKIKSGAGLKNGSGDPPYPKISTFKTTAEALAYYNSAWTQAAKIRDEQAKEAIATKLEALKNSTLPEAIAKEEAYQKAKAANTETAATEKANTETADASTGVKDKTTTPTDAETTIPNYVWDETTETYRDRNNVAESRDKKGKIFNIETGQYEADALTPKFNPETGKFDLVTPPPSVNKKGLADYIGYGQIALGAAGLLTDKQPDEYQVDPNVQQDAQRARTASAFGLEANDIDMATKSIEANRAMRTQNIINASGGSGSTALANIQKSDITSNDAMNKLASYDSAAKLSKEKYADSLDARLATMRRQKFVDKMAMYTQSQKTGAELLQAGLANVIGAEKYKRLLEEEKLRNATAGTTTNNYILPKV